ncbi:MAG: hypothetical protein U1D30_20625 [Planctomycetota bacterium]
MDNVSAYDAAVEALRSLPSLTVTGVGSLPTKDGPAAVEFVARHNPSLPYLPQLPKRSPWEGMVDQAIHPVAHLLERDRFPFWRLNSSMQSTFADALKKCSPALDTDSAAGWLPFLDWIRQGLFPANGIVKTQMVGPVTLANCIHLDGEPLSWRPAWLARLANYLVRRAVWQIQRLTLRGTRVLLTLDEPAMSALILGVGTWSASSLANTVQTVLDAIRQAGAAAGLHCCAPLDVDLLEPIRVDFLSFDALLPMTDLGFGPLLQDMLNANGRVAFGLVPTTETTHSDADLIARWRTLAMKLGDLETARSRTLITATCGLGFGEEAFAEAAMQRCHRIAAGIAALNLQ